MSAKISGGVWELDLPHAEAFVLLAMADHADHEGNNVFPSSALVAWKTGYSERQVIRIIDALVKRGVLVERARPGQTTLYSIRLSAVPKKPSFVSRRPRSRQSVTPDILSPLTPDVSPPLTSGVTPTPDIQMSPEPSGEPSGNRQLPTTPQGMEEQDFGVGASAPCFSAAKPNASPAAEAVPMDELRERLGRVFALTSREVRGLECGDKRMRTLFVLALDRPTLDALERLWATPNGSERRGAKVWHATTLSTFLADPIKDITRARQLFPPAGTPPRPHPTAPVDMLPAAKPTRPRTPAEQSEWETIRDQAKRELRKSLGQPFATVNCQLYGGEAGG